MGSKPFRSNFFSYFWSQEKNQKFQEKSVFFWENSVFIEKKSVFIGKIGDFSPIFPSQNRFQPNRKPINRRKIDRKNRFLLPWLQLILFYRTISIFVWRYFTTISCPVTLIDGSDKATIILPGGTILHLQDALYSTQFKRNLLSFKDIRWNGYHLETMNDDTCEFLLITATHDDKKKCILKNLRSLECGLYLTTINIVESYAILNPKFSHSTPIVL